MKVVYLKPKEAEDAEKTSLEDVFNSMQNGFIDDVKPTWDKWDKNRTIPEVYKW